MERELRNFPEDKNTQLLYHPAIKVSDMYPEDVKFMLIQKPAHKLSMVVQACNTSTLEAETGR